ncbi:MAG: hypothetical protein ACPL1K_05210 [Candidatus Kryptoniota bacterium]
MSLINGHCLQGMQRVIIGDYFFASSMLIESPPVVFIAQQIYEYGRFITANISMLFAFISIIIFYYTISSPHKAIQSNSKISKQCISKSIYKSVYFPYLIAFTIALLLTIIELSIDWEINCWIINLADPFYRFLMIGFAIGYIIAFRKLGKQSPNNRLEMGFRIKMSYMLFIIYFISPILFIGAPL